MNDAIVNLDNCAREPIQMPGAIQPHGVMFVLSDPDLHILQASENTEAFLGLPVSELSGQPLESFLDASQVERVRFALTSADPDQLNPVKLQLWSRHQDIELDGVVHQHDGFAFLELEPSTPANNTYFLDFYQAVSKATSRLQAASTLHDLLEEAAASLRQITGFDRVMVYRFARSGEGEVVAEARAQERESYLGQWFPASDIPEQARRLYALNPIRCIPEAPYQPVPLLPVINPVSRRPTDLTYASLRSVSQVHCDYLANMGVTASSSISIVRDGKLWGLVACHHYSPKFLPYELRKACTFLGQVLSGEIVRRELEEESAYNVRTNAVQAKFLELMAAASDPLNGLLTSRPNLLDLIPAAGAAIVTRDKVQTLGTAPSYSEMQAILDFLETAGPSSTFTTPSLKNHFVAAESMAQTASGLLAMEISREPRKYVLYFRPEVEQTLVWAGDPNKPVTSSDDGFQIGPRKSFAAWKEELHGSAIPWTRSEVRTAEELRSLIMVVSFKKERGSHA